MSNPSERTDNDLLRDYVKGDLEAFNTLYARYQEPIYSYLKYHVSEPTLADDLFQLVWERVIRYAPRFKSIAFKAWVWRITRNLLIDHLRRQKPTLSLDATPTDDADETSTLADTLTSQESSPLQQLIDQETGESIRRALSILTPRQRDIFLLRTESQLSFKDIAEMLNISINTALGCMRDAMLKLRAHLQEELER